MSNRQVAEVFPPGTFILEEIEARNWTQLELAEILGRPARLVNELVNAKRAITPETAIGLGRAFGSSPDFWMNLESSWQLSKVTASDSGVARRAALYEKYPVKEMIRRGWIEASASLDVLEQRFERFFSQPMACAFRRTQREAEATPIQLAWLCRARQIASSTVVDKFSDTALKECFARLKELLSSEQEVRRVPRVLAEAGIRLVVVEQLAPASGVDGVCFWLDNKSPVVALSLRYGRIDYFWFTLLHELRHIANGDGRDAVILDVDLVGDSSHDAPVLDVEVRADAEASDFLIPDMEFNNFVARVRPLYSAPRIHGFANRLGIHPGIVVGRLQKRGEISYANLRNTLVGIRDILAPAALTDGWGCVQNV